MKRKIEWWRYALLFILRFGMFLGALNNYHDLERQAAALDFAAASWSFIVCGFFFSGFTGLERARIQREIKEAGEK